MHRARHGRRLLFLTPRLWPLHGGSQARAAADLVTGLARQGWQVAVVTSAVDAHRGALPERLDPARITDPQGTHRVRCLEGMTPSASASVWAPAYHDWSRLGPEAVRRTRKLGSLAAVIAIDEAIAGIALLPPQRGLAVVTREPVHTDEPWAGGLERAAAVVVPSRNLAEHPPPAWRRLLAGARRVVGIPHGGRRPADTGHSLDLRDALGLSRRGPLAVTHGPVDFEHTGGWAGLHRTGVRVIAIGDPAGPLRSLADRWPRRVATIAESHPLSAVARCRADLHLFAAAYRPGPESALARAAGGITVAHSSGEHADRIVSWDPGSQSGNGLLFSSGELISALAVAGREHRAPRLRAAASSLDTSWGPAARHYAALADRVAENWQQ